MAIDTTPSTVATSALQAIPFGSLIGGPLQAAVQAQAMAAKTSWEFIQQVGLSTDASGNKTAVSVQFQYQKGGQMVNLVVPLLTIVPIPYIAIDTIDINFVANISASSSSVSEQSEDTQMGGSLGIKANVGWGPFSASADFNANYSSKKDSKATQESKYSVEYTMNVAVHASQSAMPAGLAAVLNILQSSITEASPNGTLVVSPATGILDGSQKSPQQFQLTLTSPSGLLVPNKQVQFSMPERFKDALQLKGSGDAKQDGASIVVTTDSNGLATVSVELAPNTSSLADVTTVRFEAKPVDNNSLKQFVTIQLFNIPAGS
ncbi:MAG TPA: DUF2589 domain-containing protein [Thermoanaerobaculia bacterium]|nr:DUF2589 domain-containing protein [Thermoanaerobaculia bacterium]